MPTGIVRMADFFLEVDVFLTAVFLLIEAMSGMVIAAVLESKRRKTQRAPENAF